jgi:hypothetical protein
MTTFVDFQTPITASWLNFIDTKLGRLVSAKDFGAMGDGVTDDSAAIAAAVASVITTGGVIFFPPGTYNIGTGISTSGIGSGGKAISIQGSGVGATIFNRLNGCGNIFNFRNIPSGSSMRDFTVNCNAIANPTSAAHTIVMGEGSDILVENIVINEPKTGGVMILSSIGGDSDGPAIKNCLIRNVKVNGSTPSGAYKGIDVGILIAGTNVSNSGIVDCQVVKVGTDVSLSPGMGIELKYTGNNCYISNCYVEDALQGFGFATNGSVNCPYVRLNNLHAKACVTGFSGYLDDSVIDNIIVDHNNVSGLLEPFQIMGSRNTFSNLSIKNMLNTTKYHLRFIAPASNNYVQVGSIYNTNSVTALVSFEATCTNNNVVLGTISGISVPSFADPTIVLNLNTSATAPNTVVREGWTPVAELTMPSATVPATPVVASGEGQLIINPTTKMVNITCPTVATYGLYSILGGSDGQTLTIRTVSSGRDVVITNSGLGGNIYMVGGASFTLTTTSCSVVLRYQYAGITPGWYEISRATI